MVLFLRMVSVPCPAPAVAHYPGSRKKRRAAPAPKAGIMHSLVLSPALLLPLAVPSTVIWSYSVGDAIMVLGVILIFARGEWTKARGLDKLVLFGPLCYAGPIAAFGTEHYTLTRDIATMVPGWLPWHTFWALLVGACFIAAALSLVTGIQRRLAAGLLALTFFLFVAFMDAPGVAQEPRNRFAFILMLRELAFGAGPLALAASLAPPAQKRGARIFAAIARYIVAITALVYSFEQFLHGDHVPGVPLEPLTPAWILGHGLWTYVAAVGYAVTGIFLLAGKKTRAAATWLGVTVLFVELAVYVPIGVVNFASLDNGLNYVFDTLLFLGTVLLLAWAMPHQDSQPVAATSAQRPA
jgi:uncharacterized membrane protein YphA (DoxX/SURF4 family)